mgnify:FL=1
MLTQVSCLMERLARWLVALPRTYKRALMLFMDTVFIPAALWTALVLKTGDLSAGVAATPWLYVAALMTSVPIFIRLGLYRAVVRFIGPKVIVAVVAGVTVSVLVLATISLFLGAKGIAFTDLAIYWRWCTWAAAASSSAT